MDLSASALFLLRDRQAFVDEIGRSIGLREKIAALLGLSLVLIGLYGILVGAAHSAAQASISALKLPLLYVLTSLVCFPTLAVFNTFFGSRLSFGQHLALVLTSIAIIALLLFGFAPVTLVFLLTSNNYQFYKLLNVAILALTGLIGVISFFRNMKRVALEHDGATLSRRLVLLELWMLLFGFVGLQLAWAIRPFFGQPGQPFMMLSQNPGTIYLDILGAFTEVMGFR